MRPLLALSIDLDALDLYRGLHGLDAAPEALSPAEAELIPGRAAERFGELCDRAGVKGTLFVVGRDLALGRGNKALRALHAAGHELASHSFDHRYDLSRRTHAEIDEDLAKAEAQIEALTGSRPKGFRAPGYTLSDTLFEVLARRGYAYDSSLLPSPPYYAAKAALLGALKLAGREGRSILGDVRQLAWPRGPQRRQVLELPVSVLPGVRVPYIGTLFTLLPARASTLLARSLARDPLVVLELHGIDLCDATDGVSPDLASRRRDLGVPAKEKIARIEAVVRALAAERDAAPLDACARLLPVASAE